MRRKMGRRNYLGTAINNNPNYLSWQEKRRALLVNIWKIFSCCETLPNLAFDRDRPHKGGADDFILALRCCVQHRLILCPLLRAGRSCYYTHVTDATASIRHFGNVESQGLLPQTLSRVRFRDCAQQRSASINILLRCDIVLIGSKKTV